MKCPPIPETEPERLKALSEYGLSGERPLPSLDPVVRIAARMFDMPAAAVNMIGNDHVFLVANFGIGDVDLRRDVSFCAHAITHRGVMVVPDTRLDERFHDNPLVDTEKGVRFYAGVPLYSPEGHALGALCVLDDKPHPDFSHEDSERLLELSKMASDRLELRRVEISMEQTRPLFEEFAKNSHSPVIWFDENRQILAWNDAAADLHGYEPDESKRISVEALIPERDRTRFREVIAAAVAAGSLDGLAPPEEVIGLRKDGTEFVLGLSLFCWRDRGRLRFNAVLRDVTKHRREEEELQRLASFDTLTGLANRARLYRQAELALTQPFPTALIVVDLDGFKDVNDTLGHAVGDGILREIADRLVRAAGVDATVARIGGDEFAILLPGLAETARATDVAAAAIESIAQPISIDNHEVLVTGSCGIAIFPLHAQEALELVGNADLALFEAKKSGHGRFTVFVPALRAAATARRLHSMELNRAAHDGEFVLFYQPQVRLLDGSIVGAESLIRWRHPERGLLPPSAFLPALEGGPLAATVGAWILDEACAQVAMWHRHGAPDFRMGVNLFAAQFRVGDLVRQVSDALDRHGLPGDAIELEITENIVLDSDDIILDTLRKIRNQGVGIAFDDFGTGYASLSLLKRYPVSRIKIDRTFVNNMVESRQDASVIRAILDMAHNFGLEVIAEGIETEIQREHLKRVGCAEGQGYLFGRPMPPIQFAETFGIARPMAIVRRA